MTNGVFLLFMAVCFWIAATFDGNSGGGKRARVRVH